VRSSTNTRVGPRGRRAGWPASGGNLPPLDLQEHAVTIVLDVFKLEVDELPNSDAGAEQDSESVAGHLRYFANSCACTVHAIVQVMGKPLQIRDVPEPVLHTLRERAEERHMSLASYALEVLTRHAQSKTMSEVLAGPRLRKGSALKNDDILELLASGRR
jgi:hypothetical protein